MTMPGYCNCNQGATRLYRVVNLLALSVLTCMEDDDRGSCSSTGILNVNAYVVASGGDQNPLNPDATARQEWLHAGRQIDGGRLQISHLDPGGIDGDVIARLKQDLKRQRR